jgi:phosphoserine aminotransferase
MAENGSMYNTPPTYGIYIAGLVFQWLKQHGGLAAWRAQPREGRLLYAFLDEQVLRSPVAKADRSLMNVPFTLKNAALDEAFLKRRQGARHGAAEGPSLGRRHACLDLQRDAGEGVEALVDYMKEFEAKHG